MSNYSPIFQSIFGAAWHRLPVVFQKRYANRPFCQDAIVVEGRMAVELSWLTSLLAPLLRLSGALVPIAGLDIPATVTFCSKNDSEALCFDREFRFPGRKAYRFYSEMIPIGSNEVIEWMPAGLGWRAAFYFVDDQVRLEHRGYALRLFGKAMRIPLEFLLGHGEAWEEALDDSAFRMAMTIRHRLFGKIYGYSGTFRIKEVRLDG